MSDMLITSKQVANRWCISPRTLERWRRIGVGPKYLRLGWLIFYRLADIVAYEESQIRKPGEDSTDSEAV